MFLWLNVRHTNKKTKKNTKKGTLPLNCSDVLFPFACFAACVCVACGCADVHQMYCQRMQRTGWLHMVEHMLCARAKGNGKGVSPRALCDFRVVKLLRVHSSRRYARTIECASGWIKQNNAVAPTDVVLWLRRLRPRRQRRARCRR